MEILKSLHKTSTSPLFNTSKPWCKFRSFFATFLKREKGEKGKIIKVADFPAVFVTDGSYLYEAFKLNQIFSSFISFIIF